MADIYDINEIRNIVSVLETDIMQIENKTIPPMADQITQLQQDVLDGKRLVTGQLIYLQSTDTVNVLGVIPAIITKVTKTTVSNVTYTCTILTGDLQGELTTVTIEDTKINDATNPIIPAAERDKIIAAIKSIKFGKNDLREVKATLGITHIFSLDVDASNFISYF